MKCRFGQHLLQRNAAFRRHLLAIFIFGRGVQDMPVETRDLHADRSERSFHGDAFALQSAPLDARLPHAQRGRLAEQQLRELFPVRGLAQHRDKLPRPVFFHLHGDRENIQRPGFQRAFGKIAVHLRAHVIQIGFEHEDVFIQS